MTLGLICSPGIFLVFEHLTIVCNLDGLSFVVKTVSILSSSFPMLFSKLFVTVQKARIIGITVLLSSFFFLVFFLTFLLSFPSKREEFSSFLPDRLPFLFILLATQFRTTRAGPPTRALPQPNESKKRLKGIEAVIYDNKNSFVTMSSIMRTGVRGVTELLLTRPRVSDPSRVDIMSFSFNLTVEVRFRPTV